MKSAFIKRQFFDGLDKLTLNNGLNRLDLVEITFADRLDFESDLGQGIADHFQINLRLKHCAVKRTLNEPCSCQGLKTAVDVFFEIIKKLAQNEVNVPFCFRRIRGRRHHVDDRCNNRVHLKERRITRFGLRDGVNVQDVRAFGQPKSF